MTEMEIQQRNIRELIKLTAKYPDLPILPLVDEEVVDSPDYQSYLGCWGVPEKTKWIRGADYIHIYRPDDMEEVRDAVEDVQGGRYDIYKMSDSEKVELQKLYEDLNWEDAIMVNIVHP